MSAPTAATPDVLETWEDYLLSDVFGVSLSARVARVKESLHMRALEDEVRAEAGPGGPPRLVDAGLVDRVLVTRLSSQPPAGGVIAYLLRSYDAAARAQSTPLRGKQASKEPERQEALTAARAAAATYFALAVMNPGMWSSDTEDDGMVAFVKALENPDGTPLPRGFLDHLVQHLRDNDELGPFATDLLALLSSEVAQVVDRHQGGLAAGSALLPALTALTALSAQKAFCTAMADTNAFAATGDLQGSTVFGGSLLGQMLSFGLGKEAFVGRDGVNLVDAAVGTPAGEDLPYPQQAKLGETLQTARKTQANVGGALHGLVRNLLKDAGLRDQILSWVGRVCDLNVARLKSGVQHGLAQADVSGDVHLFRLLHLFLDLCEPFADLDSDKGRALADKVDLAYITSERRFSVSGEDRLALSGETLDRWLDERNLARIQQFQAREAADRAKAGAAQAATAGNAAEVPTKTFGTVSEFFGLAGRLCHLSVMPAIARYRRIDRVIDDLKGEKGRLEQMIGGGAGGFQHMRVRMRLTQVSAHLEKQVQWRLEMNAMLFDDDFLNNLLGFLRVQSYSVCRLAAREARLPSARITSLPLPAPEPDSLFAALPAYLVENVAEALTITCQALPPHPRTHRGLIDELPRGAKVDFLALITAFSGAPAHVRNPYLRAKLIESLVGLTPTDKRRRGGHTELQSIFEAEPLPREHLAPILLRFFVDIEFTGSHTQFYDKFHYRSVAARILAFLWELPRYRTAVIAAAADVEFFVTFVNMMINDTIYHMDEALSKISELRLAQARLADPTTDWGNPTEDLRRREEGNRDHAIAAARSALKQAMQLVHMLSYLSAEAPLRPPFMTDDMRGRIAEMLNHFLTHLTGPKAKDLNVDNKEELGFRPLEVLANLATIYTNFHDSDGFLASVAGDQRSYSPIYFQKAIRLLRKHGGVSQDVLERFEGFATAVEDKAQALLAEEENLGEVPEDFLDSLTYELMRDPVRLPTSNTILDRPTIRRHLLSDHTDPFNRQHLSLDMLQPDDELRERIEAWLASRRGAQPAAPMDAAELPNPDADAMEEG